MQLRGLHWIGTPRVYSLEVQDCDDLITLTVIANPDNQLTSQNPFSVVECM
jgi:hypothetical protein